MTECGQITSHRPNDIALEVGDIDEAEPFMSVVRI